MNQDRDVADVAIIGGGPSGCALAINLASRGISAIVVERASEPKWRACGVFSSPLTRGRLRDLGLADAEVAELHRPIAALNLETTRGVTCRIEYEHGCACGFDRVALDTALLRRATSVGATVRAATVVRSIDLPAAPGDDIWLTIAPTQARRHGDTRQIRVKLIVGADGTFSSIAQDPRFATGRRRLYRHRSGITFHRPDVSAIELDGPAEGRFLFGHDWYVGIAPVPGARVNVGLVVPGDWLFERPEIVADRLLREFSQPWPSWVDGPTTDAVRVAGGLMWRPEIIAGDNWLLVGDATGFIDPLTGEGLHRAFVSSELAAEAVGRALKGDRNALRDYDRRLRSRFRSKDVVSWVLQGFLSQPRAFDYALRRMARRHGARRTLTLVLTDQLPATRALDPRFLGKLLAP